MDELNEEIKKNEMLEMCLTARKSETIGYLKQILNDQTKKPNQRIQSSKPKRPLFEEIYSSAATTDFQTNNNFKISENRIKTQRVSGSSRFVGSS